MSVIKYGVGIIICVCFGISSVSSRRGYMLTFPEELQIGATERFCLFLHNVSHGVSLKLNISCYGRTAEYKSPSFYRENHECFSWKIPEFLTPGSCDIQVEGSDEIGDYRFTDNRDVKIVDTSQITFIQTDKPMYKPGENVMFRILTVTQDLLPLSQSVERVTVQDPHGFYMKEWKDLPVKSGFASLEYRLYEKPLLGDWKIEAVVNGRKNTQTFTVDKYVLPKFQVDLDMQDSLTVATDSLMFEVCSKYTFGKPVQGYMNASVCLKNTQDSWFCQSNIRPCAKYNSEINGCHEFQVKTDLLKITERRFSLLCQPLLVLDVNVTEANTGITVHETKTGTGVWEERIKLKFVSKKYFKPHFPYEGKILVTYPTGTPAPGEEVRLTIPKLAIEKTLMSNKDGLIEFVIQNLTNTVDNFVMNVKSTDKETVDRKKYTLYVATSRLHVKQWYSPSSSYIQVSTTQQTHLNCGDKLTLQAVYSTLQSTLIKKGYLQVISKGNILQTIDITDIVKSSVPYMKQAEGTVFYPILSSDIGSTNSNYGSGTLSEHAQQGPKFVPDGPPGYDIMAPAAPPGARAAPRSEAENQDLPAPRGSGASMLIPIVLRAVVISAGSVVVTWKDVELGQAQRITDNRIYTVRFKSLSTPASPFTYVNTTELHCVIDDLEPYTEYTFSVKVIKGQRDSAWSFSVVNRTKEAAVSTAPRDLTLVPVEGDHTSVTLTWQPPTRPSGIILGTLIFYTTDPSQDDVDWVVEGVIDDTSSYTIVNLDKDTTYYFKVQSKNSRGYGPMSETITYNSAVSSSSTPRLWTFTTPVNITHEMAPLVRILVYLVTNQGEVAADTIHKHVQQFDRNNVEMYFTQKTATPGDKVRLVINAAPHSLCSSTMVDKSVLLHGGSNLVKKDDVVKRLKDLDLTSDFINDWRYCSDSSDMPPFSANAPSKTGPPGVAYTNIEQAAPTSEHNSRERRSIQQFYSNMYDSLLAFKVAGIVSFTDLDLQTRPCIHSHDKEDDSDGPPYFPGDPVPGMEGSYEELNPAEEPKTAGILKSNLRRTFPETWLWDLYEIPSSGTLAVNHTMGDTVTEWVGNTFCSNKDVGLGVSDVVRITGFQPFFMSVKLPYAVVRGEIVNIDVLVFNYLPHCVNIQINLVKNGRFTVEKDNEEPVFCICSRQLQLQRFAIRPQIQLNLVKNGRFTVEKDNEEPVFCICSKQSRSHRFAIRPQVTDPYYTD